MNERTKNSALTTALAFHYQVLIGLEKCFSLQEDQSVWFENDGDVSVVGNEPEESSQIEAKNYSNPLTDHHENLWNTVNNWLNPKFNHGRYGSLVLHTTQAFGTTTRLRDWNTQSAEQRLQTLKDIFAERTPEQLKAEKPTNIIKLQKSVMSSNDAELLTLLPKVILHTEADDLDVLRNRFCHKLDGFIPKANQQTFVEGLIGFIYEKADKSSWVIDKATFDQKRESLTAKFGPCLFTIPDFIQRNATDEELEEHISAIFAKKISEIDYAEVLPEAIGNWLELRNSLIKELHGLPQFRITASNYQEQIISAFNAKYRTACRKQGCPISNSKDLYDQVTSEPPFGIDGYTNPDLVFRNGLIHDAMDDEERNIQWKVEQ